MKVKAFKSITTYYDEDYKFLESLDVDDFEDFEQWFNELNSENMKRSGVFYSGRRLEESTGIKCWYGFWLDGFEPSESLDEDGIA